MSSSNSGCLQCTVFVDFGLTVFLNSDDATPEPTSYYVFSSFNLESATTQASGTGCSTITGPGTSLITPLSVAVPATQPPDFSRSVAQSFIEVMGQPTCSNNVTGQFEFVQRLTSQFNLLTDPATQFASVSSFISSSTISTSALTASATSSSPAAQTTTDASSSPAAVDAGLSTGAKAGIGVGVPLFVLLSAGLLAALLFLRRRRARKGVSVHDDIGPDRTGFATKPELENNTRAEMGTRISTSELPAPQRYELDAGLEKGELRAEEVAREME